MLIVTGGAGFIGSALIWELNKRGITDILVVDELRDKEKWKNLVNLKFCDYLEKNDFLENILSKKEYASKEIEVIYHLGACSDTQEQNASYLIQNNFEYTKKLAEYCIEKDIQFVYASSAATYGDGNKGYDDNLNDLEKLQPLNMYGYSKQLFDIYAKQKGYFNSGKNRIIGIKFFNVYGPNENHKGNMRSMVNKAYKQLKEQGKISLFKSYKSEYKDGEQKRDFIYIKDAVNIVLDLAKQNKENKNLSNIYNVGTGAANTWNDLANAIFKAVNKEVNIEYVDMPEILQGKYQYFTEANMQKTFNATKDYKFYNLDDAVKDYIQNYLAKDAYLGMED
jgi:ADP-L-glycero-D-manno-heptose 6-epimerase